MRHRVSSKAGAPSAVQKGRGDFATALDLELERTLSQQLADRTGIPVHGEEFGGPELSSGTAWVLDPIDGTFNYSAAIRCRRCCWRWWPTDSPFSV
ncbi:Inositol-1-monophosphatase ImpA [Nocardia africana]|uniref:Inositol-1-monophosphatase ImpA n=1 Tax=Nocardia africana TaxID=134964 RepID=A0A378WRV4_9NOCA|nr:Inositol-1-monophosphatase ImpA [Nocardia africana]